MVLFSTRGKTGFLSNVLVSRCNLHCLRHPTSKKNKKQQNKRGHLLKHEYPVKITFGLIKKKKNNVRLKMKSINSLEKIREYEDLF